MINKILIISGLFLFFSCTKNAESVLGENIEIKIKNIAKDPSSYEAIETKIVDTILVSDVVDFIINENNIEILENETKIEINNIKMSNPNSAIDSRKSLNSTLNSIIDILRTENKNLESFKSNNNIAYITSIHSCRLKNSFGALDISNYYIFTDKDLNILEINDNPKVQKNILFKKYVKENLVK